MILRFFLYLVAICLLSISGAFAKDASLDYAQFKQIPVLHDGRVKPMKSFARVMLHQLRGDTHIGNISETQWLAEALFRPDRASERRFIKVEDKKLVSALELPESKKQLYTYKEISTAFANHRDTIIMLVKKGEDNVTSQEKGNARTLCRRE